MLIAGALTENEASALMLAVEQMRQLFVRAGQTEWKIDCRLDLEEPAAICIISLLGEVDGARDPIDDVRRRLAKTIAGLTASGTGVFLCTIFRACEHDAPTIERIRRLNLLVAELSHDLDVGVIDFDRMLADIGARPLQTSYHLEGGGARDIAAYTIVKTLLAEGAFDDLIPAETLERARASYDRAYA